MSLLIKALEKAEQGKTADGIPELSLQDRNPSQSDADSLRTAEVTREKVKQASQQAAATVFNAKNENPRKKNKVLWISVALLLAVAVVGMQFYAYLNALTKPDVIMARAPAPASVHVTESSQPVEPASTSLVTEPVAAGEPAAPSSADMPNNQAATDVTQPAQAGDATNSTATSGTSVFSADKRSGPDINADISNNIAASPQRTPAAKSQQYTFGDPVNTGNAPVKITRTQPEPGVNPSLLTAYQAYTDGDDATAQRNYRSVLQSDVRNVDALLGMAAIAARQGRNNDAMGWYGKVLEVEPRNNVAQSALVNVLAQADPVSSESRIKTLIAQQPEAAHLHASLGNLYAEQKQWPAAQQAYFQAHHFAPNNAEYAFNLAVSLEQLGKPALALPYYQRALDLINSKDATTGAASSLGIDRAQLESRIRQLREF